MRTPWHSLSRVYLFAGIITILLSCSGGSGGEHVELESSPASRDQLSSPNEVIEMLKSSSDCWEYTSMLANGRNAVWDDLPRQHITASDLDAVFEAVWEAEGPKQANMAFGLYQVIITEPDATPSLTAKWDPPPSENGCFIGLANYSHNRWDWHQGALEDGILLDSFDPYIHPTEPWSLIAVCVIEDDPATLNWLRFGSNLDPIVSVEIGGDYIFLSPALIKFYQYASEDPEQSIDHYEWDWDSDGTFDESTDLQVTEHLFTTISAHTVTGKVVDTEGASDTATVEFWVSRFKTEELDAMGHSPDAYIDDIGTIHVSYASGASLNELCYGQLEGDGSWSSELLATVVGDTDIETAIAPRPALGHVMFAYGNDMLHAGEWTGSTFSSDTLTSEKQPGRPAIAVDRDDRVHVLGADTYGTFPLLESHLTHWYMDQGSWQGDEVSTNDQTGRYCDAAARGGLLFGAYADVPVGGFYPVLVGSWQKPVSEPGAWLWESLLTGQSNSRRSVSLALTSDSKPRVCFIDTQEEGSLTAVHYLEADDIGLPWSDETILGIDYPHYWPVTEVWDAVMALGTDDLPHIIYTRKPGWNREDVWYTYFDGAEWHSEFAWQNSSNDMEDLALVVDLNGIPHLFYSDTLGVGVRELMHATFQ